MRTMVGALEPRALLAPVLRWGWGAVALVSLAGGLWGGLAPGVGLLSGGGVALLSFSWLWAVGVRLSPERSANWGRFLAGTLFRYLLSIAVLVALVRSGWVDLAALALGLLVPLPIIAWRGIRVASREEGSHGTSAEPS